MPSPLAKTEICNLALDYLDEAPIQDYDTDTSARGRFMRRNFWPIAWSLLRQHPWNFAIRRAQLAASGTAPAFGYTYAYDFPADCLRVLPLTTDGTYAGQEVSYKVEGTQILTNQNAPLPVRYIRKLDDTNGGVALFDQQFVDALAIAIAQKAAHFITGKQSYAQLLQKAAADALMNARLYDSLEGTPEPVISDEWLRARL